MAVKEKKKMSIVHIQYNDCYVSVMLGAKASAAMVLT